VCFLIFSILLGLYYYVKARISAEDVTTNKQHDKNVGKKKKFYLNNTINIFFLIIYVYYYYYSTLYTQVYYFIYAFRTKSALTSGVHANRGKHTNAAVVFDYTHVLLFDILYSIVPCMIIICSLNVIQGDRRKKIRILHSFQKFFRKRNR